MKKSIILVSYNHPLPPLYWTGERWSELRNEASEKYSWSEREFYNAAIKSPYQPPTGGTKIEFGNALK